MAKDNQLVLQVVVDDAGAIQSIKKLGDEVKDTGRKISGSQKTIGDVFNGSPIDAFTSRIKNIPIAFAGIAAGAVAVGFAIKKAFDLSLEGERTKALNNQFDLLAQGVGINADKMRDALASAGDGLIDIGGLTEAANSAFINLGSSAEKLPQILDLSRRVTSALGGDIEERFKGITAAIESGNGRALRQQGIILDVDKAYKAFGKTIGVSSSELTKAQQVQAILNATLDEGNKRFGNINTTSQPIADNMRRISAALQQMRGDFGELVNSKLGAFFASVAEGAAKFLASIAPEKETRNVAVLTERAGALEQKIKELSATLLKTPKFDDFAQFDLKERITKATAQLDILKATIDDVRKAEGLLAIPGGPKDDPNKQTAEQLAAGQLLREQNRQKILGIQLQTLQDQATLDDQRIAMINDTELRAAAIRDQFQKQEFVLQQQKNLRIAEIETEFSDEKKFTQEQRNEAILAIEQSFEDKLFALRQTSNNKALESQRQVASALKATLVGGLTTTLASVGAALQRGEDAFAAFGNGLLSTIGDLAIQLGSTLLAQGLAVEAFITSINSLLPGSGFAAAAAGAGLIIFGGAIKALAGKGGGSSGPSYSSGGVGGGIGISSPVTLPPQEDIEAFAPGTQVSVVVNGNILDRKGSGLELVEIIRETFDSQGVKVFGAV